MIPRMLVLLPDQLFPINYLPLDSIDEVVVYEDPQFFGSDTTFHPHVHKLVFLRASVRRYVADLCEQGIAVRLIPYDEAVQHPEERQRMVETSRRSLHSFVLSEAEALELYEQGGTQAAFFKATTEKLGITTPTAVAPVTRKLPLQHMTPDARVFGSHEVVHEAISWVKQHFPRNFGDAETFYWPTVRNEALTWLKQFVSERLPHYETYEQSVDVHGTFLFHSGLSVLLNCGLLLVEDVVRALEGTSGTARMLFNLCGEREYVRALYLKSVALPTTGQSLALEWFALRTGLQPFDELLHKAHLYGYLTQSERSIMLSACRLFELSEADQYRLFLELTVDAADWAIRPWIDEPETILNGKFPIVTSKLIQSVSGFRKGDWTQLWDSLYWSYINRHRQKLMAHPTTMMMVRTFDRMDDERRAQYSARTSEFLAHLNEGILRS